MHCHVLKASDPNKLMRKVFMYRKLIATALSTNFRDVATIQSLPIPAPAAGQLLVRNKFVGINASDINVTAGRYSRDTTPPQHLGFESVAEVVAVGTASSHGYKQGDAVAILKNGTFSEYMLLDEDHVIPIPDCSPKYLPLLVSGLTASISLEHVGGMKRGDKVLVTAAAGGAGLLAVQIAKLAGCHVMGTCSSKEKVDLLRQCGCDRPVNYKEESLKEVLRTEYPNGVDVVFESVGGEMFTTCVNSLSTHGRLIIIGAVSTYKNKSLASVAIPTVKLLTRSASIHGFFLPHFAPHYPGHLVKLVQLVSNGSLQCIIDNGASCPTGPFVGLEAIPTAVEYLYSGRSSGKVYVELKHSNSKL